MRINVMGLKSTMGAPKAPRAINGPDYEAPNASLGRDRNVVC